MEWKRKCMTTILGCKYLGDKKEEGSIIFFYYTSQFKVENWPGDPNNYGGEEREMHTLDQIPWF